MMTKLQNSVMSMRIHTYLRQLAPTVIKREKCKSSATQWLFKHNCLQRYKSSKPPPPSIIPCPVSQVERERRKEICPPETSPYWKNIPIKLPSYDLLTLLEIEDDTLMQPPLPTSECPEPEVLVKEKCFNGHLMICRHFSKETNCHMKFSIYVPTQNTSNEKFHTLFFLCGLMCNEWNFTFRTGFQRYASQHRVMVVGADTSPRNCNVPWERESWTCGRSAGWYLDALNEPWNKHYRMYSYITKDLPEVISKHFPTTGKFGIFGHSMGGHGAIVIALRNPEFKSVSAFSPCCSPTYWDAFIPYLGEENKDMWKLYDTLCLAKEYEGPFRKILVDCGSDDKFFPRLRPDKLVEVAKGNDCLQVELNMREGYSHSFFFVATFMEDHIKYHAHALSSSD